MKKAFLDELIAKLEEMKKEPEQATVGRVIGTVLHTAIGRKLTVDVKRDILEGLMSLDGISPEEAEVIRKWHEEENGRKD